MRSGQAYKALAGSMGNEHPEVLRIRANFAGAPYHCDMFEEAEAGFRSTISSCQRVLGGRDRLTLAARISYCHLLTDNGKLTDADTEYRSFLADLEGFSDLELDARDGLATLSLFMGRYLEAADGFRQLAAACAAQYGPSHIDTLTARCYRALALECMDMLEDAQSEQEAVLAALEVTWGPEHYVTLQSRSNLAAVMRKQGRLDEAREELILEKMGNAREAKRQRELIRQTGRRCATDGRHATPATAACLGFGSPAVDTA